jgi:hypothetical protein
MKKVKRPSEPKARDPRPTHTTSGSSVARDGQAGAEAVCHGLQGTLRLGHLAQCKPLQIKAARGQLGDSYSGPADCWLVLHRPNTALAIGASN